MKPDTLTTLHTPSITNVGRATQRLSKEGQKRTSLQDKLKAAASPEAAIALWRKSLKKLDLQLPQKISVNAIGNGSIIRRGAGRSIWRRGDHVPLTRYCELGILRSQSPCIDRGFLLLHHLTTFDDLQYLALNIVQICSSSHLWSQEHHLTTDTAIKVQSPPSPMSEEQLKAFWEGRDTSLGKAQCSSLSGAVEIAKEAGFSITAEDIQSMQSSTINCQTLSWSLQPRRR